MFWLENCFLVPAFFAYSLLLVPLAYLVNFVTIIQSTGDGEGTEDDNEGGEKKEEKKPSRMSRLKNKCRSMKKMFQYLAMWLFAGLFVCIFIAGKDVYYFCKLLSMHKGCREAKGLIDEAEEDEIDERLEVVVFEEVRIVVIETYLEIRNRLKAKEAKMKERNRDPNEELDEEELEADEVKFSEGLKIVEMLKEDEELIQANEEDFVIKQSAIQESWRIKKAK